MSPQGATQGSTQGSTQTDNQGRAWAGGGGGGGEFPLSRCAPRMLWLQGVPFSLDLVRPLLPRRLQAGLGSLAAWLPLPVSTPTYPCA
jgi:hypothetical protein